MRARIILGANGGLANQQMAATVVAHPVTVGKWRERFVHQRLDGLLIEPRPGAPRRIGDDLVGRVLLLTLESKPTAATHWSTPDMARRVGIGQDSVRRIWKAFRLQPRRPETLKPSPDPPEGPGVAISRRQLTKPQCL